METEVNIFMKVNELDQLLRLVPLYGHFDCEDVIKKLIARKSESARTIYSTILGNYISIDFRKIRDITLNRDHENNIPEAIKYKLHQVLGSITENGNNNIQLSETHMLVIEFEMNKISQMITAPTETAGDGSNLPLNMPHEIELSMMALKEYFLIKRLVANLDNSILKDEVINGSEYLSEIPFLNSAIISLLNTCNMPHYKKYRDFNCSLCDYINQMDSNEEFEQLVLYLDGGYKHFSSLNRIISNSVQGLNLGSLNSHPESLRILSCTDNIQSQNAYDGPALTNIISNLLTVGESGNFKTVSLCDLNMWRNALSRLCEMFWQNSKLITPTYNSQWNNYSRSLRNAQRLLMEVKYIEERFCSKETDENLSIYTESFRELITKLEGSVAAESDENIMADSRNATKNQLVLYRSALINILIGSIELCLIPFTPLIDPVEKDRLKRKYVADDIQCFNYLKSAYDFQRIAMKYKNLGEEIYQELHRNLDSLNEKQNKLKEKVALRPEHCAYSSMVKDITHFLTTNCNPEALLQLINNIENTWKVVCGISSSSSCCPSESVESCEEIVNKVKLWIANSQRFVHHTLKQYSVYYQDFIVPLQCSIQGLQFGFEGIKLVLLQIKTSMILDANNESYININVNNKLHNVLGNIAEFPSSQMLNIFNVTSSRDILKNRCPVFSILNKMSGCESDYFHLLKAKIVELKTRVGISQFINQELFAEFDFAFNIINQVWQREEEVRRQKQKENDSLYLTKTKCDEVDDEVQELNEIDEIFPTTVHADFGDFIREDTLEKVFKLDKRRQQQKSKKDFVVVQEDDYSFIGKNFINFVINNSQTYYHCKPKCSDTTDQLQFKDYFKKRFQVFNRIYNKYKTCINDWLDDECFNSFYFSIAIQNSILDDAASSSSSSSASASASSPLKQGKIYNFYKDPNIQEILSCTDVLNDIELRIKEQLELYPEHATLMDIKKIIQRIRSFPTTAPVVRFNTGFQILRQNIALWNEVAHKNNNLKVEEQEVAQFVQKWTRSELKFCRNSLSLTCEKVEAAAYKYWFFIYNLIHEFIAEREIDFSLANINCTVKRFEEHQVVESADSKEKKFTVDSKDVINILRQFVESSSYGDFHVRMQLILAFELYLHNFLKYSTSGNIDTPNAQVIELISGLRNLQLYFGQFSDEIVEHNKAIKAPIEKKLKELVKIESYNKDLSYTSMRNNVARVHRNLNKFLKEYEQGLKEKITAIFQPKNSTTTDYNYGNDKGKDLRYESKNRYYAVNAKYFVLTLKHKNAVPGNDIADSDSQTLLSKVHRLFNTSRNVVMETVTNAQYPQLIIALDNLLTQQLERCDNLRHLTVDRTKERNKQKLEAKQILQQKRKALTDLFKALSVLGVNYKTGLMELSMCEEFEDTFLPPFCIKTLLSNFKESRIQPILLQLNENLDIYFNKCVFKLKLLRNIMLTPLSELGPPNIERIKGYAVDMFLLVQNQRRLLASTTKSMNDFRAMLQQLKDLNEMNSKTQMDESHMNFIKLRDQRDVLKTVIARIRYVGEQLKLYILHFPLNNCSVDSGEDVDTSALLSDCDKILSLSKSTLHSLNSETGEFIFKDRLNEYRKSYHQMNTLIGEILNRLKSSHDEYLPIAKPLLDLTAYANDTIDETFKEDSDKANSHCNFENVSVEFETIIHSLLLSLQSLYKKYPSKSQQLDEEEKQQTKCKQKASKDDKEELDDQHLKNKLYGALKDDWNLMNMEKINQQLMNILLTIKLSAPSLEKVRQIQKLLSIQPLLEQFNLIAEYFLYQQLGAHKVSAKMLSIILTVFVEIGTKGFCVPQDLLQDEEGGARNDQREGEGFGLEDGTGEKDASDKIESEDQLDDAKRPEDRKEENDKNEANDCQEEKGIEMSDNFEGEMQDVEKQNDENDDSGESENEEDTTKEMGETEEGADKLDDQIWGDDETPDEQDEEKQMEEEESGKGSNEEQDAHNDLDSRNNESKDDDGKNNPEKDSLDAANETNGEEKKKSKEKDIDDALDEDGDNDQINPYHNELEEPPEPEDFNLEDVNVNEDDDNDETQQNDDNPFDIDTMKENMEDVNEKEENRNEEDKGGDTNDADNDDDTGDENDVDDNDKSDLLNDKDASDEEKPNEEENEENVENPDDVDEQKRGQNEDDNPENEQNDNRSEKLEEYEQSRDQSMKEDNIQSVPDIELKGSKDQVENNQSDNDVQQDQDMDEQNTGEEKEGIGQAQNEHNDGGHQGIAETKEPTASEDNKSDAHTKEKRKQGQTDEDRSIGNADQNKIKRLKTIEKLNEDEATQNEKDQETVNNEMEADEYQHVKEPKTSDKVTLDNATEEQSKKRQPQSEEEPIAENEDEQLEENLSQLNDETKEEERDNDVPQQIQSEKLDKKSENPSKLEQSGDKATTQEQFEVDGETVETSTVSRNDDTTAHCNMELIADKSGNADELSAAQMIELRRMYQDQVTQQQPIAAHSEDHEIWHSISNRMAQNARDLCEQLRLILEPTKCTRLKGDYRTGRRINMKKIIPYIASQFRKDKIWLRRTKPAQRDYKITIAIDDSKSMHHNNSKVLTLEAISLVSQSLTLLESGRLSVISFGEQPKILLNHSEQFDGPKLVTSLQFSQDRTKIAELLDFIRTANAEEALGGSDNGIFENLLLILSDGRNIFGEGKSKVKNAIKLARLGRIFMVYIIIDNPDNKDSILDIQTLEMCPNNSINIKSYLDDFPFPYYVIVRDLNQLPIVLSEAMRQWFELVNSEQ